MPNKIAGWQITKIHVAANKLGLIDKKKHKIICGEKIITDKYHEILSSFKDVDGIPCSSCKDLNYAQANTMLELFEKMGFVTKRKKDSFNLEEFIGKEISPNRPAKFASIKQLELICKMWIKKSRDKSYKSLMKLVVKIVKIDSLDWLLKKNAQDVIVSIKNLGGKKNV